MKLVLSNESLFKAALRAWDDFRSIQTKVLAISVAISIVAVPGSSFGQAATLTFDDNGNQITQQSANATTPAITAQPVAEVVALNGSVSFSVNVVSPVPVTYQWQLNGVNIAGATGDTLFLPSVAVANEGNYTVVITYGTGQTITSAPATLTVATDEVVAWGHNESGEISVPHVMEHVVGIAGGEAHALALLANGTVMAWGDNTFGQTSVPSGLSNVVEVAAEGNQSLALLSNGTVVQWGENDLGNGNVPVGLSNVVAIAQGSQHALALLANGTVTAWGTDGAGQTNVPLGLDDVVAIAAGAIHSLALKADGTVAAWGDNADGQTSVPNGLSSVVAIAAGANHSLALLSNGTVVAWGDDTFGQIDVPAGLSNVVAVAGGDFYSAALLSNGTVVTWGDDGTLLATPPQNLSNVLAIAGGGQFILAVLATDPRIQAPVIVSPAAMDAGLDAAFQYQVEDKNGATTFSASGLPPGLSISQTGLITGTPTTGGTYVVTIYAQNSFGTSQTTITFNVNSPVPLLTSGQTLVVYSNAAFSSQITASNSPTSFTSTALPAGLSLSSSGLLSGVTTAPLGAYHVSVTINNLGSTNTVSLTLDVQRLIGWGDNAFGETTVPQGLGNLVSVASGTIFALGLNADGTLVEWGDLGVALPAGVNSVAAIAAGSDFGLALLTNGTVVGWGDNTEGQSTPPAGMDDVVAISAGNDFGLALLANGTVAAWGGNESGQTSPPPSLNNVIAISAGYNHALALLADGTVVGWGDNSDGEINIPAGLSNVVAIAGGDQYSLALLSNGTVVGWGAEYSTSPIPANLSGVISIAAGATSMALLNDGTVVTWGNDFESAPVAPSGLNNVVGLFSGQSTYFALLSSQVATAKPVILNPPVILAGVNSPFYGGVITENSPNIFSATGLPTGLGISSTTGQITGTPTTAGTYPATLTASNGAGSTQVNVTFVVNAPVSIVTSAAAVSGALGEAFNFQLTASNGPTTFSATGLPPGTTINSAGLISGTPTQVGTFTVTVTATNASGSTQNTFTITTAMVVAWGENFFGETNVPANLSNVVAVSAGSDFSLALQANGTVVGWGYNLFGQTTIPAGLANVVQIAAGGTFSLALRSDGSVVAWGDNSFGETNVPAGIGTVAAVAAGPSNALALLTNGTVVGWGEDNYNSGGGGGRSSTVKSAVASKSQGTQNASAGPGAIDIPSGLSNVVAIAAGGAGFSLALQANGTVVGWGDNSFGEINIPANLNNVVAISAGLEFALALQSNGTVVGWGDDTFGEIDIPVGLNNVVAISAGSDFAVALQADGTIVMWGDGSEGQTTVPSNLTNAIAVSAGESHTLALLGSSGGNLAPVILNSPFVLGSLNAPFSLQIVAQNNPTSYSASGLPTGLSMSSSGLISGTPSVAGTFPVTITVGNATGPTQASFSFTINSGATLTPVQAWQATYWPSNPTGGAASLTANPAGDGLINLLKFAFGLNPLQNDSGMILQPGTGTAGLPSITLLNGSQLQIEFVELVNGGITYHPEFSSDLQNWTEATGTQLTTVSINSLWQRVFAVDPSPGTSPRYARVRISGQGAASSPIMGYISTTVGGGTAASPQLTMMSPTLINPIVYQGVISTISGTTITIAGASFAADQFDGANGEYYAVLFSPSAPGAIVDITGTGSDTITTAVDMSAFAAAGYSIAIHPHVTIGALLGATDTAGLQGGPTQSVADEVDIYDGNVSTAYWYYDGSQGGTAGWVDANTNPVDGVVISPWDGVAIKRKAAGNASILWQGQVKTGSTLIPVDQGMNVLGTVDAAGLTLDSSNLITGIFGFVGSSDVSTADQIFLYNGGVPSLYWYYDGSRGGTAGWVDANFNPAGSVTIAPGSAFAITRKGAAFNWTLPLPNSY